MQKRKKNLYDFDYEEEKEKKLKKRREKAEKKSASKKNKKNKHTKNGQANLSGKYDDEIIIGVTKVPERKKSKSTKQPKKIINRKKQKNEKNIKKQKEIKRTVYNFDEEDYKCELEKTKKSKKIILLLKITTSIILFIGLICFFILSPIFNVTTIVVEGNSIISKDEIISLSGIKKGENIFKFSKSQISKNIKQNAYINKIQINKSIPNTIKIIVEERTPKYIIEFGNGYVYISNQGYILEISNKKLELPTILGISTKEENIVEGKRLEQQDLIKLGTVIKIMDTASDNQISNLITTIDIKDSQNFTLYLESEKKTVYLGDCTNLETRMLYLISILNNEKNIEGEIFINMNLNIGTEYPFFRESI